jgi:hypothetical protein
MRRGFDMKVVNASGALLLTLCAFISSEAFACGESLFRVGKGVAYRAYSAPMPVNVLVYVETEAQREMAVRLADAGHRVTIANGGADLAAKVGEAGYEVIIAPDAERSRIGSLPGAAFVALVETEAQRPGDPGHDQSGHIRTTDSLKTQLRIIHESLNVS